MPNNFDFLRLMAATMVLVSHQFFLSGYPEPKVLMGVSYGGFGVSIFFAISGYLVTKSWMADPNVWRFMAKRLLRIIPALVLVVLVSMVVIGPLVTSETLSSYFSHSVTWQYLHNIHLKIRHELPGVFLHNPTPNDVNGSLWTLPMEFRWYLVVAALGVSKVIRSRLLVLIGWFFVAYWVRMHHQPGQPGMNFLWCFGLYFYGGIVLASIELTRKYTLPIVALIALLFAMNEELLASALLVPMATISFGRASFPVIRYFGKFGDFSYGVYLFAFPVQQTVVYLLGTGTPFYTLLTCAIVITYGFAYLSWHCVEAPMLALKKRLYSRA